jgi:uncharacterized membrane protein YqjE
VSRRSEDLRRDTRLDDAQVREPETSLGELTSRLTSELGELFRTHVELAKQETVTEVRTAAKASGMLAGSGVAAHFALLLLSFAAAWGLAAVMPNGLAFLIVGVVWAIVAGVLYMLGRKQIDELDPTPHATIEEIQEDKKWLTKQN